MDKQTCEWCGSQFLRPSRRGPAPKFCSDAHRQAAHRKRSRALAVDPAIFESLGKIDVAAMMPKIDPAIFERLGKIDVAELEGRYAQQQASGVAVSDLDDLEVLQLVAALTFTVVLAAALLRVHAYRLLLWWLEESLRALWTLWSLKWTLQESSPTGDLFVSTLVLLLGSQLRHLWAQNSEE